MNIQRIDSSDIDRNKWNSCVHFATNGNIFGYKWYIDGITKDWEALVEGDYESVMPLIWKKNWLGRKALYVPTLMREAGIYSANALSERRVEVFLDAIPTSYKRAAIQVDQFTLPPRNESWKVEQGHNCLVYMNRSYEELSAAYNKSVVAQLDKARTAKLKPSNSLKPETIADFYKSHSKQYTKENYHAYLRIMYNVLHRGWGFPSGITDKAGNLLAVNFIIFSHSRLVSFLPVVSKAGRAVGAMELLTDLLFHTNANKQVLLDFNEKTEHLGFGEDKVPFYYFRR